MLPLSKYLLLGLLLVHAALHFLGAAKAYNPAAIPQLTQSISKPLGVVWLLTGTSFAMTAVACLMRPSLWWTGGFFSVLFSQLLIFLQWKDARAGTLINGVILLAALSNFGSWQFQRATQELRQRVQSTLPPSSGEMFHPKMLEGLPQPVARYLGSVVKDGTPLIRQVWLEQTGTFNTSEADESWKPFRASQYVTTIPPAFVWSADIAFAPGVPVRVHDAYVNQRGILRPLLFGLIPLTKIPEQDAELARGELLRFLAESPWYPTALLPPGNVRWESMNEHEARAHLSDGLVSASLVFRFGAEGLVESVYSQDRTRTTKGQMIQTPWEGVWREYREHAGILIPTEGEVSWRFSDGLHPYWRGQLTSIRYEAEP